jgi:TRAP-type C4-dicarboxylate transport system substrate-binding protein
VKNKVFLILLAAVFAMSLSIVGCTGGEEETPPELSLIFSDHNPSFNAEAQALTAYANSIAAASNGKIEITKIGYGGEILPQMQAFEGVQAKTADCAAYVPEIGDGLEYAQVMQMPFMGWGTPRNAEAVWLKLIAKHAQILAQFPTTLTFDAAAMTMMPPVMLHYYAEDFVADSPDDIAGKEILSLEGNLASILTMLGATGVVLSFPDLLDQVPKGIGDGYAQHSEFCFGLQIISFFHSHTFFPGGIVMTPIGPLWNTESYNKVKNIIGDAGMAAAADAYKTKFIQATAVDTAGAQDWMLTHGDTVTSLTASQTAVWAAAVGPYFTSWENACADANVAKAILASAQAFIAGG